MIFEAMKIFALVFALFLFLPGCAARPGPLRQAEIVAEPIVTHAIVTIPTRPGVQQRVLTVQGEREARATLLLFPGGDGAGNFTETPQGFRLGNDFLVRSADLMANEAFMAAIVDAPSDRATGMTDGFRRSPQHLKDVQSIVEFLAERYLQPVFLVGTGRGTLSLAYVATALRLPAIRGIIFTSSYEQIGSLPLEQIRYPVLFIHHRDDACPATPYDGAKRLYERFRSSRVKGFVTVLGGAEAGADPCAGFGPHSFFGKEHDVVKLIADWTSAKEVPSTIGP